MKRMVSLFLVLLVSLALCPAGAVQTESPVFADVEPTAWYAPAVQDVQARDLMNGVAPDAFRPEGALTRAMTVTILWRLAGEPAANDPMSFTDVPSDAWYTEAVRWAASEAVVEGFRPDRFGPDNSVTRQQLATIFYRWAQRTGCDTAVYDFLSFPDRNTISDWAKDAVLWASSRCLLTGKELPDAPIGLAPLVLAPRENASRAEVAVFLSRFCRLYTDKADSTVTPAAVQFYGPGVGSQHAVLTSPAPDGKSLRAITLGTQEVQQGPEKVLFSCRLSDKAPEPPVLSDSEKDLTSIYNDAGQLAAVVRGDSPLYSFSYDKQGRVCQFVDSAQVSTIIYNLTYDQNGNPAFLVLGAGGLANPAVYTFDYTQADGTWVLTGCGRDRNPLSLFA